MKYKLLVLDLDGTLTNSKKVITEHTRTTLIEAQKRGLKIVLASGRPTYGVVPLATSWNWTSMRDIFFLIMEEKSSTGKPVK